jgi:hypothetical protein
MPFAKLLLDRSFQSVARTIRNCPVIISRKIDPPVVQRISSNP